MTVQEKVAWLEQLKYLRGEVDLLSQRIAELELAAQGGTGRITGLPRGTGSWDHMGEAAAKIADLKRLLDRRRGRCMALLGALYGYIDDIPDSRMRQIMTYRYIDGESWQRIAVLMGEQEEQQPRRQHNRFLERERTLEERVAGELEETEKLTVC